MSIKGKLIIVSLSVALAFYAIVGGFLSVQKEVFAKGDPYVQLRIFGDVLRHIVNNYVDEPDLEKVRVGALRGLTEGLDPYSSYLTQEQAKKYQAGQPTQTTGLVLSKVAGYIYVITTLKGSPADKAGLHTGDFVEYIDKFATRDISLYDAEELLSSANSVELKVFRRGRRYKTTLKPATLTQPAIEASLLEPGIGYLHITSLADGKVEEIKKQVQDLQKKGAQKLVLDLRGAANGSLENSAEVANLFVKSGTLAKALGHNGNVTKTIEAESGKAIFNGPISLVADRSTASGGEVIAAALLTNKRGELVGERTFGAGSEQKFFELKSGAALYITVTKFADPAGNAFMRENPGIVPSVEVKPPAITEDSLPEDSDQQTGDQQNAEANIAQLPNEPTLAPADDAQLKKAVELLKGNQTVGKRTADAENYPSATVQFPSHQSSSRTAPRL